MNNYTDFELNEYGLLVFKHKTNKKLFLHRSYRWVDSLMLIEESEDRNIIMSFKYSTFDFYAWEPITKEEYNKVHNNFTEIYK